MNRTNFLTEKILAVVAVIILGTVLMFSITTYQDLNRASESLDYRVNSALKEIKDANAF
jgi:hypothetical protein